MRNRPDPLRVTSAQISRAMRWPIGTAVTVTKDDGSLVETVTQSEPWRRNGTWVILVDGFAWGCALARVAERAEVF